jgi:hypothetical protein
VLGNLILYEESGVRTGLEEEGENLSEVSPSSDRFGGKTGKAVRSSAKFRQVWRRKGKSCQKKPQVQTGIEVKQEKLSEVASSSDRFGGRRRKAVRNSLKFRQVWR